MIEWIFPILAAVAFTVWALSGQKPRNTGGNRVRAAQLAMSSSIEGESAEEVEWAVNEFARQYRQVHGVDPTAGQVYTAFRKHWKGEEALLK